MADKVFEYAGFVSRVPAGLGLPSGLRKYPRACGSDAQLGRRVGDGGGHPGADVETTVGQRHRGAEQVAPWRAPVVVVHELEQPQYARDSDRPSRGSRVGHGCGVIGVAHPAQVVLAGRRGGGFAAVVGLHRAGASVVIDHESTAAEPRRLRFDQTQHRLGNHQGVGGGTTVAQYPAGRLGRQWVGRGHGVVSGPHGGHVAAVAGSDLGILLGVPRRGCRSHGRRRRAGAGRAIGHDLAGTRRVRRGHVVAATPGQPQHQRGQRSANSQGRVQDTKFTASNRANQAAIRSVRVFSTSAAFWRSSRMCWLSCRSRLRPLGWWDGIGRSR